MRYEITLYSLGMYALHDAAVMIVEQGGGYKKTGTESEEETVDAESTGESEDVGGGDVDDYIADEGDPHHGHDV